LYSFLDLLRPLIVAAYNLRVDKCRFLSASVFYVLSAFFKSGKSFAPENILFIQYFSQKEG